MRLESVLRKYCFNFILPEIPKEQFLPVDFSIFNKDLKDLNNSQNLDYLELLVKQYLQLNHKHYAVSGYLEIRNFYQHFDQFKSRCVHLGLDFSGFSAGAAIAAPYDGVIHSFQDNSQLGDYGPTIILEHVLLYKNYHYKFYSLYGHLSTKSLLDIKMGKLIKQGEIFATVGERSENGGWPVHIHFQLIKNLGDYWGNYPGVATIDDTIDYFKNNCPDPNLLFNIPELDRYSMRNKRRLIRY